MIHICLASVKRDSCHQFNHASEHPSSFSVSGNTLLPILCTKIITIVNRLLKRIFMPHCQCSMTSPFAHDNTTNGIDLFIKGLSIYGAPSGHRSCILGHEIPGDSSPQFSTRRRLARLIIPRYTNPRSWNASGPHPVSLSPVPTLLLRNLTTRRIVDGRPRMS